MNSYLRALSFLTIIPLPFVSFGPDGNELSNSASSFPLAGATLGLILAAFAWLLSYILPVGPVVVIVLIFSFLLTRGLHFDGLADTADGLIGTTDREKAFRAMDDSAVGVMGAVSIFFVYLLKFSLLAGLQPEILYYAIFFMLLAGRWSIVFAGTWFPPARNKGLGDLFLRGLQWPILLKASLWAVLIIIVFILLVPPLAIPIISGSVLSLLAALLLAWYAARRLGGITGDILGASSELGEVFFLIGFYPLFYISGLL